MIPLPRIRANLEVRPNLAPMVGLTLAVLVAIMVVVPAGLTGFVPIAPQVARATAYAKRATEIILGIDRDGNHYLNRRPIQDTAIAAELRRLFEARPGEYVLYVHADRALDYGLVQKAMDLGASNGARVIGLVVWDSTTR